MWLRFFANSMSKRPKAYQTYDRVRIVNPLIFVRCGYPLNKKRVRETLITPEQEEAVRVMLRKFDLYYDYPIEELLTTPSKKDTVVEKILDVISGFLLLQHGFGGKERTIHTEERPELKGAILRVINKQVVKTGTYYAPSYTYDYYNGGHEWEPGGLNDMKTHVILEGIIDDSTIWTDKDSIKIEQCHVERVVREDFELEEV